MPISQTLKFWRGEDLILNFTMTPTVDITGWVISFTITKSQNNQSKVLQQTATITSGPNGQFQVLLSSAQTDAIQPDKYFHDVWRTNPGSERILALGDCIVGGSARIP